MIPAEVAAIADLIWPEWSSTDDELASADVLAAAYRIHNAGYRKQEAASLAE